MKGFAFYNNYYELIKYLDDDSRLKLYDAIMQYMFEDKEPELENLLKGIWINLKMPLDTSKNNAGRGGRPKKEENRKETELKPIKNRKETEKETNNISNFLFLISNNNKLNNIFKEYLDMRKKLKAVNSERAINSLKKKLEPYDEETQYKMIEQSIIHSWKDIYELKEGKEAPKEKFRTDIPWWFNATQEELASGITKEQFKEKHRED